VKEAVLPFNKFPQEAVFLGPEMKSTGEVMGLSRSLGDSYRRASLAAGNQLPESGTIFISVNDHDKFNVIPIARDFIELGFEIVATSGTHKELARNGIPVKPIFKVGEGRPNVVDGIKNGKIHMVINTPLGKQSRFDEEAIGKAGVQKGVNVITTLSGAHAAIRALRSRGKIEVYALQDYY